MTSLGKCSTLPFAGLMALLSAIPANADSKVDLLKLFQKASIAAGNVYDGGLFSPRKALARQTLKSKALKPLLGTKDADTLHKIISEASLTQKQVPPWATALANVSKIPGRTGSPGREIATIALTSDATVQNEIKSALIKTHRMDQWARNTQNAYFLKLNPKGKNKTKAHDGFFKGEAKWVGEIAITRHQPRLPEEARDLIRVDLEKELAEHAVKKGEMPSLSEFKRQLFQRQSQGPVAIGDFSVPRNGRITIGNTTLSPDRFRPMIDEWYAAIFKTPAAEVAMYRAARAQALQNLDQTVEEGVTKIISERSQATSEGLLSIDPNGPTGAERLSI